MKTKELIESDRSSTEILNSLTEKISKGDKVRWKDFRQRFISAFDSGALSEKDNVWTVVQDGSEVRYPGEWVIVRDSDNRTPKQRFTVPPNRLEKI